MNRLLHITDLSVQYDDTVALSSCNLDIFDDDFVGIIGPNGGGKTSLIKSILGLIKYSGNIIYCNDLIIDKIGYMPQLNRFDISFPISVREVIRSGLQNTNSLLMRKSSSNDSVDELMETVGITHLAHKPIGELSGGELQRAVLCRAIISNPMLLILDEPANFVDNQFESELYDILKRINEKMAIIMVSHDVGTITSIVKSIVCVNKTLHRHDTSELTAELLDNYHCPIQVISHGTVPHTVLKNHGI